MNKVNFINFLESLKNEDTFTILESFESAFNAIFEADSEDTIQINPNMLSKQQLTKVNSFMKRAGYDWRGPEDALKLLNKHNNRFSGDMAQAIKYAIAEPKKQDSSTKAARAFGTTDDFSEAGYLTTRGTLLDFSGKREGGTPGTRAYDHRNIGKGDENNPGGYEGMIQFMNEGNIRLFPGTGFNLIKQPTKEQYSVLYRFIKDMSNNVDVEITKPDGTRLFDKEYPPKIHPTVIFKDIENALNQ